MITTTTTITTINTRPPIPTQGEGSDSCISIDKHGWAFGVGQKDYPAAYTRYSTVGYLLNLSPQFDFSPRSRLVLPHANKNS
jgi:hypothetical protein